MENFINKEESRLFQVCEVVDLYNQKRREKISEHALKMREIENERFKEQSPRMKDKYTQELRDLSFYDPTKFTPSFEHPNVPYLLGLSISDDDPKIGEKHYIFGKQGLSNPQSHEQVVIDWRQASISSLYYNWDEGEEYEDEINGFERTGTIEKKVTYGIKNRELLSLETANTFLQKKDGSWINKKEENTSNTKKKESKDHRLVDIVSLISKEQFSLITNNHEGCFYLTGGAGSGKTTVALHRLSYLAYNYPEKIHPEKCLVVMFNRSLREYVNQTSKDLIDKNVAVETIYSWATKALKSLGIRVQFSINEDRGLSGIKKSLGMYNALLEYIRISKHHSGGYLADFGRFYQSKGVLGKYIKGTQKINQIVQNGEQIANGQKSILSYDDIGLLLCLAGMRNKGKMVGNAVRYYDHIIVDEAQDLSLAELKCLSMASNNKSMTICADKKQKILDFVDSESFDVFQMDLKKQNLVSGELNVSFRSTKQIMEMASQVSGESLPQAPKEGLPPKLHNNFVGLNDCLNSLKNGVQKIIEDDPTSLYAVICRYKKDASYIHKALKDIPGVRLQNNTPDFKPGVIIVNVHQVKGLEFSGVLLWNPDEKAYPNTRNGKNLLYVAITRASEKLAVYTFKPLSPLLKKYAWA